MNDYETDFNINKLLDLYYMYNVTNKLLYSYKII